MDNKYIIGDNNGIKYYFLHRHCRPYAKRALTAFGHSEIIAFKGFGLSNNQKFVVVFFAFEANFDKCVKLLSFT